MEDVGCDELELVTVVLDPSESLDSPHPANNNTPPAKATITG